MLEASVRNHLRRQYEQLLEKGHREYYATFRSRLRARKAAPARSVEDVAEANLEKGTITEKRLTLLIVVEDEFFSRFHAVDLVGAAGYRAIEASNADEAIAILEARKDIRIVFTDIDMPGSMDGLKLVRAVRDRWPPIELILTSGHFDVPESDIPKGVYFFSKPYRDEEIVSALHKFAC